MPEKFNFIIEKILSCDRYWCESLQIYNPYRDPWPLRITKNVPDFDGQAYKRYPEHNFVYDKYFIAKSQGLQCGILEDLITNKNKVSYPIFIKPRWGNKSASSKNCFKIKCYDDLLTYKEIPEMMWSEFIDDTEGMTDYIMHNGNIVFYITYIYSPTQHGVVADDWKFVSINSKPPIVITNWVKQYMNGFSGICNVQYRGEKIIEVGLRLARGGAYIYSTNNTKLITAINDLANDNIWDYNYKRKDFEFKDFYSFKCYTTIPILYLYPQYCLDNLMKLYNCKEFYEYYFEPSGKGLSMVFFQFLHEDYETGMKVKHIIENVFSTTQILFYLLIILILLTLIFYDKKIALQLFLAVFILYFTKILNPFCMHANLWNAQKQALS